jgi:protease-4
MSYVGGIGVTGSYVETAGQTEKEGGVFVGITGGVLKDAGNSDKHITKEERAMLQRNVDILHEEFIKKVSENRNIPIEDVKKLADGSDMPGRMALENKLIDAVGDEDTALEWLKMKMNGEEVITCE